MATMPQNGVASVLSQATGPISVVGEVALALVVKARGHTRPERDKHLRRYGVNELPCVFRATS
jgi:hypothetical protein